MDYKDLKKRLAKHKGPILLKKDEFKYAQNPIGKTIYTDKNNPGTKVVKPKKAHWSDRIKCKVCGDEYTRSKSSSHKKTRHHQDLEQMNTKLMEFINK
jgi:hypothetical protein